MARNNYKVKLLIIHADGEEETRTVRQEGWTASDAIEIAKQRVLEEEPDAEDVLCQWVS